MVIHYKKAFIKQTNFIKQDFSSVVIDNNISFHIKQSLAHIKANNYVIITDSNVQEQVLPKVKKELSFLSPLHVLSFPAGEQNKTNIVKDNLEKSLSKLLVDKYTVIFSLGGGVVSDITGFLAATYYRGLPLINIPTSLIGMIDASIGGKVGINTSFGKNTLGYIKHPLLTLINIQFLETLPKKELLNGFIEACKYAITSSPQLFNFINKNYNLLLQSPLNIQLLQPLIEICCQIKLHIVEQDPEDNGVRKILNFGHTTAHALETLSKYEISHGEAVAIGMRVAILLSLQQGYLELSTANKILSLLNKLYKNRKLNFPISSVKKAMLFDKKCINKDIQFVLLKKLGEVMPFNGAYCSSVPLYLLNSVLEKVLKGN